MQDLEAIKKRNETFDEPYLVDYPKAYEFPDRFSTLEEAEAWCTTCQNETQIYKRIK